MQIITEKEREKILYELLKAMPAIDKKIIDFCISALRLGMEEIATAYAPVNSVYFTVRYSETIEELHTQLKGEIALMLLALYKFESLHNLPSSQEGVNFE